MDDEIYNIGKWKKYSNTLSKVDLKLCEPHLVDNAIFNYIKQKEYYYKSILDFTNFHKLNLYNMLNINYYLKKDQIQNEQLSTQLFAFADLLHKIQNKEI